MISRYTALPVLLTLANICGAPAGANSDSRLLADLTYSSKYMIDGFKIGGDHPVVQPCMGLNLLAPGLIFMFWSSLQLERMNQNFDEYDLLIHYERDLIRDSPLALHLAASADYWIYPKPEQEYDDVGTPLPLERKQGNKFSLGLSFPELLAISGWSLVPSYRLSYWTYWHHNRRDQYEGGALHKFEFHYAHDFPTLIPGTSQLIGFSGSLNYHDGVFRIQPGWTHSTLQFGTSLYVSRYTFSFSLEHQWTYHSDLNAANELWTSLSVTTQL